LIAKERGVDALTELVASEDCETSTRIKAARAIVTCTARGHEANASQITWKRLMESLNNEKDEILNEAISEIATNSTSAKYDKDIDTKILKHWCTSPNPKTRRNGCITIGNLCSDKDFRERAVRDFYQSLISSLSLSLSLSLYLSSSSSSSSSIHTRPSALVL